MNGYPPDIIIERKGKLGDLIGYFYFIESYLFCKDISESQTIIKNLENNIDPPFRSSPFLYMDGKLVVIIHNLFKFSPRLFPNLVNTVLFNGQDLEARSHFFYILKFKTQ